MVRILQGNTVDRLLKLPRDSIQTCVTSPPYWGLRDYGTEPQEWPEVTFSPMAGLPEMVIPSERVSLGLESDPWSYVGHIVRVFRCVRDVLRPDGTLWLNMGDSYVGGNRGGIGDKSTLGGTPRNQEESRKAQRESFRRDRKPCGDVRHKAAGGLRPKNMVGMPWRVALALQADGWYLRQEVIEEVQNYCPKCGWEVEERIWRYAQDREIIWHKQTAMPETVKDRPTKAHEHLFLLSKSRRYYYDYEAIMVPGSENTHGRGAGGNPKASDTGVGWGMRGDIKRPKGQRTKCGKNEQSGDRRKAGFNERWRAKQNASFSSVVRNIVPMRNKRSVWTLQSEPFPEAHFATFPTALVEPCIKAGSPQSGVVLDPFGGAGTTGVVAERLQRDSVLIELSGEYCDMSERRIVDDRPLLAEVCRE